MKLQIIHQIKINEINYLPTFNNPQFELGFQTFLGALTPCSLIIHWYLPDTNFRMCISHLLVMEL